MASRRENLINFDESSTPTNDYKKKYEDLSIKYKELDIKYEKKRKECNAAEQELARMKKKFFAERGEKRFLKAQRTIMEKLLVENNKREFFDFSNYPSCNENRAYDSTKKFSRVCNGENCGYEDGRSHYEDRRCHSHVSECHRHHPLNSGCGVTRRRGYCDGH